jgi:hypothetical protein
MTVAVIMVIFPFLDCGMRGGWCPAPSLVVAGEGSGQAVEEPGHPEGSVGLLERGLPFGAELAEAAAARVKGTVVAG